MEALLVCATQASVVIHVIQTLTTVTPPRVIMVVHVASWTTDFHVNVTQRILVLPARLVCYFKDICTIAFYIKAVLSTLNQSCAVC